MKDIHLITGLINLEKELLFYQKPDIPYTRIYGSFSPLADVRGYSSSDCSSYEKSPEDVPVYYSQMGSPLPKTEVIKNEMHRFIPYYGKCYVYSPKKWMQSSAIRSFLSYWYSCAIDAADGELASVFKEIEKEINIKAQREPINPEIYTCRWNSL